MKVAGKVALITGGTGGLGKAFARALLAKNASAVCLVDIIKNGQEVALELNKQYRSSQVDYVQCDVTDYNKLKGVFDRLVKDYGGIDIVCNNAGIQSFDHDIEQSIKAFRINLEAVFFGTKLGMDYMDTTNGRGGGIVVNIASMAAFLPIGSSIVYSGSKSGVVGLSRAASQNFDLTGVRVNALCPSFADTAILDTVPGTREFINNIPGHHILEPDYVAKGFLQLVEDESLNGAVMRVTPQKGIDFTLASKQKNMLPTPDSKL